MQKVVNEPSKTRTNRQTSRKAIVWKSVVEIMKKSRNHENHQNTLPIKEFHFLICGKEGAWNSDHSGFGSIENGHFCVDLGHSLAWK